MSLLTLPSELLLTILSPLRYQDLFACSAVNRLLHKLVKNSNHIQHLIHSQIASTSPRIGVHLGTSLAARVDLLKARESAWRSLRFSGVSHIDVPPCSSNIYDLTGGVYLTGETRSTTRGPQPYGGSGPTHSLRYVRLPDSEEAPDPAWQSIDLGEPILDVGLNVQEHDLVAVMTRHADTSTLHIHLLSLTTGRPHPAARLPILPVTSDNVDGHLSVVLEVAGRTLALLLLATVDRDTDDRLLIWDWQAGTRLHAAAAPWHTYGGLVFLAEDTLALLDTAAPALECVRVDLNTARDENTPQSFDENTAAKPPQSFALGLPRLGPHASVLTGSCRGEPPPLGRYAAAYPEPHPSRPEDAVLVCTLIVGDEASAEFTQLAFVVHRRALLEALERGERSQGDVEQGQEDGESGQGDGERPDGGAGEADEQEQEGEEQEPRAAIRTMPWTEWGPGVTRWFATDAARLDWITVTCGQRFAMAIDGRIHVWDFNPLAVKRREWEEAERAREEAREWDWGEAESGLSKADDAQALMEDSFVYGTTDAAEDGELADLLFTNADEDDVSEPVIELGDGGSTGTDSGSEAGEDVGRGYVSRQATSLRTGGLFVEEVVSRLPFVCTKSREQYDYQCVLLEEGRVLGLVTDDIGDTVVRIDVLHLG